MSERPHRRQFLAASAAVGLAASAVRAGEGPPPLPSPKPVPRMQTRPLPYSQIGFERDGDELTRYHFAGDLRRPFLYPVIGPSGRPLTRMGHPRDPEGHSHHNSVWVSHNSVNGDDFWGDRGAGRVVHQRVLRYEDGEAEAAAFVLNSWVGKDDRVHLAERRAVRVRPVDERQWLLVLDLQFEPGSRPCTFGATAFGPIGVRMAKTIGVNDGGGLIRNSEGQVNEQGPQGAFRKRARWVDYSGPVTASVVEGVTLFDHPANPGHPCPFHVRADGWMGASPMLNAPITVEPGESLRLRYALFVHAGIPSPGDVDRRWEAFARESAPSLA